MGKARPGSGHRVHKSGYKAKLHQESERARPSERLRQEGKKRSAQGQTRAEKSAVKAEKAKLRMGAAQEKLAAQAPAKPPGPVKRGAGALGWSVHGFIHGKVYEVEHENVGTEGAHHSELVGEAVGRWGTRRVRQAIRDHPAKAAARAESRYVKATAEHRFLVELEKHPDLGKNALARFAQKQRQKRQYAKQAREAAKQGARAAEKTAVSAEKLAEKAAGFVKRHPGGVVIALACVLLLFTVQSCASSLVSVGNGTVGAVAASTYPAQDGDMLGAEAAYCALEAELQHYLDTYTSTHDYDEYHFDLDAIEHDPYVLISMLSALHEGEWTLEEVRGTIQTIFDRQYILTEEVVTERRYYIETDTWTDSEGNTHTSSYRVYYDYYICTVTLKNEDLSHLPIYIMSGEQISRYALYMAALGNRPDLFPNSGYVDKYITNPPQPYDVPEEYLSDPTFSALLTEAEKYLGYPYVWGGSSPATSFDCSGFLSYVLNQCGWDVGRLGAQGLYNYCTPVSSPRPGDLVFFRYTYDAPNPDGVTHCGLYVGDGMMLHCGDPVQFTSLNTSYWQSHFYAWGRLP
ncbi:C40 family peptidase [uncultured Oscillibacter sp.]|uniref:C40 family peptidase n=1 Tax=uncultured Oscillibacter sp. TaxID=876091 RepID=UPI00261B0145|nr:NlpC/P60 family protein [uncultured Oscillibacter sp.]